MGTNRLTTITGTPTATLTHDANGNITSEGTRTFVYDLSNRLVSVLDNSTEVASYVYDARNLRVKKTTPTATTVFHYDTQGRLIAETDTAGNTLAEYIYLNDTPLATIRPTDTPYYYHTDHINTPRVMTNSSGTAAWKASYNAFGYADIDASSTITNNIRFPGQYYDSETNLHYNWNRYYDPRTGRYLTPDPIGLEGGIDPYVYTENDPVNRVDPKGLATKSLGASAYYGGGFEFAITTTTCCENNAEYLVKFVTVCGGAGISASGGFSRGILSGSIPFGSVSSGSGGCPKTRYYLKHETTFGARSVNIQADKRGFSAGVDIGLYGIGTTWVFCSDTVIIKQVRSGCCRKSP